MLLGPGSNLVRNSPKRTVRSGFIGSSTEVRFEFGSNGRKSAKKTVSVRERFKKSLIKNCVYLSLVREIVNPLSSVRERFNPEISVPVRFLFS